MTRIVLGTLLLATQALAASGELKAAAQKLSDAHRDSIVWLSVIAKTSMTTEGDAPQQLKAALQAQDKETKSEAIGTVVDPSGLVVTSLASIDKGSVVDGKTINTPMGPIKLKSNTEIKEVKVIMPDGTELPGDLVMKDVDLGLGFVKVRTDSKEAQGVTFQSINLADSARGAMLDDCIGLGRLDENLNREASIITTEITGITTKPRTFYRVMTDATGCPIFLSTGKLLGISVMRQPRSDLGDGSMQMTPVVLPAADVAKVAEQAKSAKAVAAAEKKEEAGAKKEGKPEEKKPETAPAPEKKAEGASKDS
jgi:Trypsin-like peptidase domain